ncbi:MAG: isoaspartyl peptidase/L-asparaginase [Candidatus Hodarchaeota archaeon]
MKPLILCHLGVRSTPLADDERKLELSELAKKAVREGFHKLESNSKYPCLAAVEKTVNILEESGITNAGIGAIKQSDGVQRADASIMYGPTLASGAVSSLENIKYPISIARKLLDFSELHLEEPQKYQPNFYFCGYFIEKLFESHGETIPDDWKIKRDIKGSIQYKSNSINEGDTVGAVAIDEYGNLAAATSTGGHRHSYPGRIGDSPIIGAGTYANDFCAVSNTGRGENVIKVVAAKRVCDLVKEHGLNAMLAVDKMIKEFYEMLKIRDKIGTIAIDRERNWTVNFSGPAMTWALKGDEECYFGQLQGEKLEF